MGASISQETKQRASHCVQTNEVFRDNLKMLYICRQYLNILAKYIVSERSPSDTISVLPDSQLVQFFSRGVVYSVPYEAINILKLEYSSSNTIQKQILIQQTFEKVSPALKEIIDDISIYSNFEIGVKRNK